MAASNGHVAGSKQLVRILFFVIVFQRIAVPIGDGISVTILAFPFGTLILWRRGYLGADRGRTMAYLGAIAACVLATAIVQGRGDPFSITSLTLLIVLYLPFCLVGRSMPPGTYEATLTSFTRLMSVLAVVAIVQTAIQLAGVGYDDPFRHIPADFVMQGYNTNAPVEYGSSIYRANAVVFLEPSFLSQYLALSFVISLVYGSTWRKLLLDGLGILTTVSGTGIVLIALAAVLLTLWKANVWLIRIAMLVLVIVLGIQATPAAGVFNQRLNERSAEDSSFTQRFSAPFERAEELIKDDDVTFVAGLGAGAADLDAQEIFAQTERPISYSPLTKLPIEYGLLGFVAFGVFALYVFFARTPSLIVSFAIVVFYFLLSGSLLQPPTVALCWMLTSVFAERRPRVLA